MQSAVSSMQSGLILLNELSDNDVDWVLSVAREEPIANGAVLVAQGSRPDSLYLVLSGLLKVVVSSPSPREVAALGPGQIAGEMSFLENRPASATVVAVEESQVLALPIGPLEARLAVDRDFSARLFKALAMISSRRLRDLMGIFSRMMESQSSAPDSADETSREIAQRTHEIKTLFRQVQKDWSAHAEAELPPALQRFSLFLNETIGDAATRSIDSKDDLGARVQGEILPWLLHSTLGDRLYSKPRGYSGDFQTLAYISANQPSGGDTVGTIADRALLALPAVVAVRNSERLLKERIVRAAHATTDDVVRVVCLGCALADEVFAALRELEGSQRPEVTLIDFDAQALEQLGKKRDELPFSATLTLRREHLARLAFGRMARDLPGQDLVCSISLADYLSDRFFIALLNYAHAVLKPGGEAVFAFFHPRNPSKAFMEYVLDWRPAHRSEAHVTRLFLESAFKQEPAFASEPAGIIAAASARKAEV